MASSPGNPGKGSPNNLECVRGRGNVIVDEMFQKLGVVFPRTRHQINPKVSELVHSPVKTTSNLSLKVKSEFFILRFTTNL